jgi:hypothetical protein
MSQPTIYERLKAAGCEIHNHASDLYVVATPVARRVLMEQQIKYTSFRGDSDGRAYYEVPFAYDPWWKERQRRAGGQP